MAKKVKIILNDWHYSCGDGCCDMYGTDLIVNEEKCDNQYAGDDVTQALEFTLKKLGFEVEIKRTYNN